MYIPIAPQFKMFLSVLEVSRKSKQRWDNIKETNAHTHFIIITKLQQKTEVLKFSYRPRPTLIHQHSIGFKSKIIVKK